MSFLAACASFAPRKAEVEANLARIGEVAHQASLEGVELLLFPETITTGYFLEGGVLEASLTEAELLMRLDDLLTGIQRPIDLVIGFYMREGGDLHNAAGYFTWDGSRTSTVSIYRKIFLPTYGVFDEERFISRGQELAVFDTRLGRMAILICEDVWHSIMPTLCALKGAQIILVPAASPGRGFKGETVSNLDRYHRLVQAISEEHGVFTMNCQLVGFEGGKGFIGGSSIVDPFGNMLNQGPMLEEHLTLATIDLDAISLARAQQPLLPDLQNALGILQRSLTAIDPSL